VAYVDSFVTIYQVKALSLNQENTPIYSYIGIPKRPAGKLDINAAIKLGCDPRLHGKSLKDGLNVTLKDGRIVTAD
jgi:hypothetical protein